MVWLIRAGGTARRLAPSPLYFKPAETFHPFGGLFCAFWRKSGYKRRRQRSPPRSFSYGGHSPATTGLVAVNGWSDLRGPVNSEKLPKTRQTWAIPCVRPLSKSEATDILRPATQVPPSLTLTGWGKGGLCSLPQPYPYILYDQSNHNHRWRMFAQSRSWSMGGNPSLGQSRQNHVGGRPANDKQPDGAHRNHRGA